MTVHDNYAIYIFKICHSEQADNLRLGNRHQDIGTTQRAAIDDTLKQAAETLHTLIESLAAAWEPEPPAKLPDLAASNFLLWNTIFGRFL